MWLRSISSTRVICIVESPSFYRQTMRTKSDYWLITDFNLFQLASLQILMNLYANGFSVPTKTDGYRAEIRTGFKPTTLESGVWPLYCFTYMYPMYIDKILNTCNYILFFVHIVLHFYTQFNNSPVDLLKLYRGGFTYFSRVSLPQAVISCKTYCHIENNNDNIFYLWTFLSIDIFFKWKRK